MSIKLRFLLGVRGFPELPQPLHEQVNALVLQYVHLRPFPNQIVIPTSLMLNIAWEKLIFSILIALVRFPPVSGKGLVVCLLACSLFLGFVAACFSPESWQEVGSGVAGTWDFHCTKPPATACQ